MLNVYRERLDGLWINVGLTKKSQSIHMKISHFQVDNQLSITLFPTIVYPIESKMSETDSGKNCFSL